MKALALISAASAHFFEDGEEQVREGEPAPRRFHRAPLQPHALPLIDLIQEGNIGLMKAVERFDCTCCGHPAIRN